jgi:DNA segregation ATPase FtsK/SpoIIIE-like protein
METPILYNRTLHEKGLNLPLSWRLETHSHLLIVGGTGSGKTYAERLILGKIVKYIGDAEITICDFKNDDFRMFDGLPRHYGYDDCAEGLTEYYSAFQRRLDGEDGTTNPRILLFDEFVTSREKKAADEVKSKLSSLLMLGRSYKTHIIIGLQRADAEHFKAGARDQFGAILGLGNLSKERKQMLFSEYKDEITADCGRGTGYFLRDGIGISRALVPTVGDMAKLNRAIQHGLSR